MFNLLNFPYNLQEMMQDEDEKRMELLAKAALLKKEEKLTDQERAKRLGISLKELKTLEKNQP